VRGSSNSQTCEIPLPMMMVHTGTARALPVFLQLARRRRPAHSCPSNHVSAVSGVVLAPWTVSAEGQAEAQFARAPALEHSGNPNRTFATAQHRIATLPSIGLPFASIGRSGVACARAPSMITAAVLTFYVSRLGICEHNTRMTSIADRLSDDSRV